MKPYIIVSKKLGYPITWIVEVMDVDEISITNFKTLFVNYNTVNSKGWCKPIQSQYTNLPIFFKNITVIEEYNSIDDLINAHFDEFL